MVATIVETAHPGLLNCVPGLQVPPNAWTPRDRNPGGVLSNHLRDECAKVAWNWQSSATRFPTPEKQQCFPVPANELLSEKVVLSNQKCS